MSITKEEKMLCEDWKQRGKKAWTYTKENGLIPQMFCTWVKKVEETKAISFVEIPKQLIRPAAQRQQ